MAIAVLGVPDHGMGQVIEMATDLMPASTDRIGKPEGITRCLIAADRDRKLGSSQATHEGQGRLGGLPPGGDRMLGDGPLRQITAGDHEVGLMDALVREGLPELASHRRVASEDEDPRGAPIQAMHRIHPLPESVTHRLKHHRRVIDAGMAMDHPPGRLVDCDQSRVEVEPR